MKNFAYPLAVTSTGLTTNIGTYDNQYPYKESEFCKFDRYLFFKWKDKDKPFGVKLK